jgi:hypothetical protein
MKKIANIIFEIELTNHVKLDWINYVEDSENAGNKCDLNLPTLFIGWKFYKSTFPMLKPNILNKNIYSIYPRVCWEFSMEEKITDHFSGVEKFIKIAPKEFIKQYTYCSIDPIINGIENESDLIRSIEKLINPKKSILYQYKDEIMYVFDRDKNIIVGIYLTAFYYFGFNIEAIQNAVYKEISYNIVDSQGLTYQSYYRIFPEFDQLKRSMVIFLT